MDERRSRAGDDTVSFGQELRREREVRDVSLEEISKATKISVRFLRALETDEFSLLPADVFTKGFIRGVSRYLGLDPEKMVNSYVYHRQQRDADSSTLNRQREAEDRAMAEMRAILASRRWLSALLALLVVGAVAGVLLAVRRGFRDAGEKPESGPGVAATAAASWVAPAPPASTSAAPADEIVLGLTFEASSWMELSIDGAAQISELIPAGTTRQFRAEKDLVLTLGNSGGVRAELNGRPLPRFGAPGQVLRGIRIDRNGVRPPPRPPSSAAE